MPMLADKIMPSTCHSKRPPHLTLELVLANRTQHPYSLQDFADYLRQSYCIENLTFWSSVVRYRQCAIVFFTIDPNEQQYVLEVTSPVEGSYALKTIESPVTLSSGYGFRYRLDEREYLTHEEAIRFDLLKQKFDYIVDTFLSPNSPQEINIPCEMREYILNQYRLQGCYHPALFNLAKDSVLELMRVNSFIPWVSQLQSSTPSSPALDNQSVSPTRSSLLFFGRKSHRGDSNSSLGSEEDDETSIDDDPCNGDRHHPLMSSAFFKRFTANPWKTKDRPTSPCQDECKKVNSNGSGSRRPMSSPASTRHNTASSDDSVMVTESKSWTWKKAIPRVEH
ncbi:hypothetical protein NQZ79_g1952 [Umbelopsis isabellina]|nr:hypothetical protein NQZ79_g1952 [Umbelopsis isabellina]